jgi:hypothetical protein
MDEKVNDLPTLEGGTDDDDSMRGDDSDEEDDDMIICLSEFNSQMDWSRFAEQLQHLLLKKEMWELTEDKAPKTTLAQFADQQEGETVDRVFSAFCFFLLFFPCILCEQSFTTF